MLPRTERKGASWVPCRARHRVPTGAGLEQLLRRSGSWDRDRNAGIDHLLVLEPLIQAADAPWSSVRELCGAERCTQGAEVVVVASPFGAFDPELFHAVHCEGVVAAVAPQGPGRRGIVLLDVAPVPGTAGAPVVARGTASADSPAVLAIVAECPVRTDGAPVALTFAISWDSVCEALRDAPSTLPVPDKFSPCPGETLIGQAAPRVVVVEVDGGVWGTGLILTKGTAVTSAHTLRSRGLNRVWVKLLRTAARDAERLVADVVWMGQGFPDLAVLRFEQHDDSMVDLELCSDLTMASGSEVFTLGCPLLPPWAAGRLHPMLTKGIMTVRCNDVGEAAVLITTAAVHPGGSGGPLFMSSTSNLKVAGIMTRCTQLSLAFLPLI